MEIKKGGAVSKLLDGVYIPRMFKVRQIFPRPLIKPEDIPYVVEKELSREKFSRKIKPGMNIAITAGSRGVANVAIITKAIADFVSSKGAKPFVVPAMGSHGGATAEGQVELLESYGITEEFLGCPIKSSMEVITAGTMEGGREVVIDKNAAESDGIIVSCRIKPHNAFRGKYESGIMKMMAVGLGKQVGAERVHSQGMQNIGKNIEQIGKVIIQNAPILFAVPCIENAFDETCKIVGIDSDEIADKEPELLKEAFSNMPKIIVGECDVLIVDEIGKNYSGTGVDPNITGTFSTKYASGGVKVQRTAMLDLSEKSHGNGLGIGLSSVITKKLFDKLDFEKIYPNCITSTVLESARIPCVVADDREAIQLCIKTCVNIDKKNARIVRIPNSLHIEHIMLSEAYYDEIKKYTDIEIESEPEYVKFDEDGNLL
ncbi:MAG: lactate racemase domain-containing protein [Clostridium sp.]|jgi:hypothetical protein|uniref:DUF362 domain-containing protein n=1 Tax=Clostridium sp. TaxID=1506 RepID=UPI0025B81525|nr:DUF362 domain-containing protein [Clostridium sp.]MCH3965089.1 lactate racemase domain-containing protein [Clostridium sp.]MCI1714310.1 lactate racemase domain-containing protein [Clostridium sp.]MCI1798572.1 lactate racemase domain-containing protein [Clostridium sp.]MCI1812697.1 lactate racemase domain-containing protein [Clostridium sp.]MCI1869381.1 lactate racemase domain-containing protein [Clostridium sp.]